MAFSSGCRHLTILELQVGSPSDEFKMAQQSGIYRVDNYNYLKQMFCIKSLETTVLIKPFYKYGEHSNVSFRCISLIIIAKVLAVAFVDLLGGFD